MSRAVIHTTSINHWNEFLPYFRPDEFACKKTGNLRMDLYFMRGLTALRKYTGILMPVTSGYRDPSRVDQSEDSAHTYGLAADIAVSGADAYTIISRASLYGFTGIGVCQHGPRESRFIHLDMLPAQPKQPRPTIWSYNVKEVL